MIENHVYTASEAIEYVRSVTNTVILSYSRGKDSLAAWLRLRRDAPELRIVPVYHYLVPGLSFSERYIAYIERVMGTRVIQLPHPRLTWWLKHACYQPPAAALQVLTLEFPWLGYADFIERVREHYDVPDSAWVAVGTTQNDSPQRRATFKRRGALVETEKKFFPIADFRKADILEIIRESGVKLPPDYRIWRRSYDGVDWFFLEGLRRHYPDDYERVLRYFPFLKLEHARYEIWRKHAEKEK